MKNNLVHILHFQDYHTISESKVVDGILDKIKTQGMGSLTPHEKDVLDRSSKDEYPYSTIREEVMSYLDDVMLGGEKVESERKSFGSVLHFVSFKDRNGEQVAELELRKETGTGRSIDVNKMFISSVILNRIRNYYGLSEEETDDVLRFWFNKYHYELTDYDRVTFDTLFHNEP